MPVLLTVLIALLFGCTREVVPCPKNSSTVVYNTSTNTIKPATGMSLGGSDIQYDKNGLVKGKPTYKNPRAK